LENCDEESARTRIRVRRTLKRGNDKWFPPRGAIVWNINTTWLRRRFISATTTRNDSNILAQP